MLKNVEDGSVKIFHQKQVYCEKYEKLEKENPAAWIADNDLTPFKVFEVLFGNNFQRIRRLNVMLRDVATVISVSRWLK